MKRWLLILTTFLLSKIAFAEHITGGQIYYTYAGMSGGNYQYNVTLLLYRDSASQGAQLDASAALGIFQKGSNNMVWNSSIPLARRVFIRLSNPGPCVTNAPRIVYEVGYYEFTVSLPATSNGYTIAYQRCCRINGISNLAASGSQGATYTADIPGTSSISTGPENNSAKFVGSDTVLVCGGYPFTYSFAAIDADATDQLRYSFCSAYLGGGQGGGTGGGPNTPAPNPPAAPPYPQVNYSFPYNSASPLGLEVNIDANTGLITGKAPAEGIYVVTVCVNEIRNGVVIATQRKDLQIKAGGCDIAKAQLNPEYISCDGFTLTFSNLSNSPLINSYYWEFGDPASGVNNSSTLPAPTHTYTTAGDYTIKLVTNRNQECSDSTTAIAKVWPGFFPDFTSAGVCLVNPVLFTDRTRTNYGIVDSWHWDFGDATTSGDTSTIRNPSWTFADTGTKNVRLIVTNSKGCIDTVYKAINMFDKPPITLAFRDTLICVPDNVRLQASGNGVFSWSPTINMINANTATPTVNPTTTTIYKVQLDQQGCVNEDSVQVRVVRFVTIEPMNDTTICLTDSVQLDIASDGLQYQWTPLATLNNATLQNPIAIPTSPITNYQVTARIGSCTATDNIVVTTVPYPKADAGADTTICYNTPAFLKGWHDGTSFIWTPAGTLTNANTLNPVAYPVDTTEYILTSYDNNGCPKPGYDTVLVNVMSRIRPFAGNDTLVVVGQPLRLNAEGGVSYSWSPSTGLNSTTIKNPIGLYDDAFDSIHYTVKVFNEIGCYDSAFITVRVFKTNPYVFVPTAFTPNGDGRNDVIRPIAVGVQEIKYFRIYNRWGQLLFSTNVNQKGWDGTIGGTPQGSNVFVWMVSAIDYTGKPIFLKGTVTLIR